MEGGGNVFGRQLAGRSGGKQWGRRRGTQEEGEGQEARRTLWESRLKLSSHTPTSRLEMNPDKLHFQFFCSSPLESPITDVWSFKNALTSSL